MRENMENFRQLSRKVLLVALSDAEKGKSKKELAGFGKETMNLFCEMAGLDSAAYEKCLLKRLRKRRRRV